MNIEEYLEQEQLKELLKIQEIYKRKYFLGVSTKKGADQMNF